MKRWGNIVFLLLAGMVGQGCSSRAIHEAEAVVAQADSLWQAGLMYGIDAGDSLTLAQAYETLSAYQFLSPFTFHPSSSFTHACYHYGKLLRAKDNPAEAMQAFINATHTRTPDYHILGRVYSNMGSICHLAGDFPLSYDMYEKSAEMNLRNGDSLLYFYNLNNMAYELAEQGKKEETMALLNIIPVIDEDLSSLTNFTKAELYMKIGHYDSAIYYAHSARISEISSIGASLILAQSYSFLEIEDSAVYYANFIIGHSNSLSSINNALYILSNDDKTKDIDAVRQTSADRSDTQKMIAIQQGKLSQAVLLLEADLDRKPDWRWLYAVIATVLIIGAAIVVYVYRKHKKQELLVQKISNLTNQSKAIQEKHEKLVNGYKSQQQRRMEETLHRCDLLRECPQIAVELKWSDFDAACSIIDSHFYLLASKLRQKAVLNETEIRLCILVLIGMNRIQIANTMPYALNSIGKLKDQTAKKMGTSGKNLRDFLIKMVVEK